MSSLRSVDRSAVTRENDGAPLCLFNFTDGRRCRANPLRLSSPLLLLPCPQRVPGPQPRQNQNRHHLYRIAAPKRSAFREAMWRRPSKDTPLLPHNSFRINTYKIARNCRILNNLHLR